MVYRKYSGRSTKSKDDEQPVTVSFGTRKIAKNNFSNTVSLPATALENLGTRSKNLKVELVQENGEKFIKLTPAKGGKTS